MASESSWTVYVLRCRDGSLYTGITNNVERRLAAHGNGVASRYTRARLPVEKVYGEEVADRSAALKREAAIKKMSRNEKLKLMTANR
jgi:putative endonuclease